MASKGAGCGTLLKVDTSTDQIDQVGEWDFLTFNTEVVGAATKTTTTTVAGTKMADVLDDTKLKGYYSYIKGE